MASELTSLKLRNSDLQSKYDDLLEEHTGLKSRVKELQGEIEAGKETVVSAKLIITIVDK
jgi:predicted nuclease with TOPRIM domain